MSSSDAQVISFDLYKDSPDEISVLAKLEGQPEGSYPVEVLVATSGAGWRTLTFDFGSNRVNSAQNFVGGLPYTYISSCVSVENKFDS